MLETHAKQAEKSFREAGWDVTARLSPIGRIGWELVGKASDGGKPVYGFAIRDMALLVSVGQVARIAGSQ